MVQPSNRFLIGVVGLPSAGKSTFVNSLAGRRYLDSGETRTTLEPSLVGYENIFKFPAVSDSMKRKRYFKCSLRSDDGKEFDLLDLPGVSDAKDKNKKFDKMTLEYITACDLIFWVTSAETAFIHAYEKEFFKKMVTILSNDTLETGKLHQMAIVISKFEFDDEPLFHEINKFSGSFIPQSQKPSRFNGNDDNDEIRTGGIESSSKVNIVKDVEKHYGKKFKIIKFSAYSRIYHHKGSSDELKNIVIRKGIPPRKNLTFELEWADKGIDQKRNTAYINSFYHHLSSLYTSSDWNNSFHPQTLSRLEMLLGNITDISSTKEIIRMFISGKSTILLGQCKHGIYPKAITEFLTNLADSLKFPEKFPKATIGLLKSEAIEMIVSKDTFTRLNSLISKESIYYQRIYYNAISRLEDQPFSNKNLSAICPNISKFDICLFNDPTLAVSKEFSDKVITLRAKLWGDDVTAKENFAIILYLVQNGTLKSLFQRIESKLPDELRNIDL